MTKSQERKLNQAIRILEIKYQVALSKPDIKHPLAWALYQTWKEEDKKEEDIDIYKDYRDKYEEYHESHGGIGNVVFNINQDELNKLLR